MKDLELPDEVELEDYYFQLARQYESEDPRPDVAEPIEVAKSYYVEDNRPVLYDEEEHRE